MDYSVVSLASNETRRSVGTFRLREDFTFIMCVGEMEMDINKLLRESTKEFATIYYSTVDVETDTLSDGESIFIKQIRKLVHIESHLRLTDEYNIVIPVQWWDYVPDYDGRTIETRITNEAIDIYTKTLALENSFGYDVVSVCRLVNTCNFLVKSNNYPDAVLSFQK